MKSNQKKENVKKSEEANVKTRCLGAERREEVLVELRGPGPAGGTEGLLRALPDGVEQRHAHPRIRELLDELHELERLTALPSISEKGCGLFFAFKFARRGLAFPSSFLFLALPQTGPSGKRVPSS